jgi:hypothetical protein
MSQQATCFIGESGVADLAQKALQSSSIEALRHVEVGRVDGNHLVLSGHVSTFYYKQQAQELVRQVVKNVELVNDIQVD